MTKTLTCLTTVTGILMGFALTLPLSAQAYDQPQLTSSNSKSKVINPASVLKPRGKYLEDAKKPELTPSNNTEEAVGSSSTGTSAETTQTEAAKETTSTGTSGTSAGAGPILAGSSAAGPDLNINPPAGASLEWNNVGKQGNETIEGNAPKAEQVGNFGSGGGNWQVPQLNQQYNQQQR